MLPVPFYSPAKHSPADSPAKPGRNPETGRGIFGKGIGSGIPIHLPVAAAPRCGLSRLNYGDAQYRTLSVFASHSLNARIASSRRNCFIGSERLEIGRPTSR